MTVTIYHNPACGTSRHTLALIRNSEIDPEVIEYLKTPPSRDALLDLIQRAGLTPRALLREKGTPYAELGLANPALTDDQLLDAMMAYPILINRPLVVTPLGLSSAALATLLWLHVLGTKGITIGWGQYMRVGLAITPPVLLVVLAALALWLPLLGPA